MYLAFYLFLLIISCSDVVDEATRNIVRFQSGMLYISSHHIKIEKHESD